MKQEPKSEIVLYQTEDNRTGIEVRLDNDTVWLTQAQLSDLFQRERSVITKHIRNIFEEGELSQEAVCANHARTAADGKTYQTVYYNLDVIISVGYRVKSHRGTQFRQWICDIYQTSVDYDPRAEMTQSFLRTVQNKMHWAVHGRTAAEVIYHRASAVKPHMGLTSWKGAKPRKPDVAIAKNYLAEDELKKLSLIVTQYLDFAELQAM